MNSHWIAQIVGFGAYALSAIGMLHRKDKSYLNYTIASQFVWSLHFALMQAPSGSVTNLIALARSCGARVFSQRKVRIILLIVLLIAFACVQYFIVKRPIGYIPPIGSAVSSAGVLLSKGIRMRLCLLFSSFCWFTYAVVIGSLPGMVCEITMTGFNLWTMYKMQKIVSNRSADHRAVIIEQM